jgi:hypothetical protein
MHLLQIVDLVKLLKKLLAQDFMVRLQYTTELRGNKMTYTYLKTEVKVISKAELTALKSAYYEAQKNDQLWIMQAMEKVFDDIFLGVVKVSS